MGKYRNPINNDYLAVIPYAQYNGSSSGTSGYQINGCQEGNWVNLRSTVAWSWSKDGYIEESQVAEGRIDYDPTSTGEIPKIPDILLEPFSTNLLQDNLSATGWSEINCTMTSGQISPDAQMNGFLFESNGISLNSPRVRKNQTITTDKTWVSFFVKPMGYDIFGILVRDTSFVYSDIKIKFDVKNLQTTNLNSSSEVLGMSIEPCPNGWFRLIMGFQPQFAGQHQFGFGMLNQNNDFGFISDGAKAIFYGFQCENTGNSYHTSLIYNTTTSALSRSADSVSFTPSSYFLQGSMGEIIAFRYKLHGTDSNSSGDQFIGFNTSSYSDTLGFYLDLSTNNPTAYIRVGGVTQFEQVATSTEFGSQDVWNNIAILHRKDEARMYMNGSQVGATDTNVDLFDNTNYPTELENQGVPVSAGLWFGRLQYIKCFTLIEQYTDSEILKLLEDLSKNPNKNNPWTR